MFYLHLRDSDCPSGAEKLVSHPVHHLLVLKNTPKAIARTCTFSSVSIFTVQLSAHEHIGLLIGWDIGFQQD